MNQRGETVSEVGGLIEEGEAFRRMAAHPRAPERRLYTAVTVLVAAVALAGFARTYYLKLAFGTPPLSALLHVHGLVMTLWLGVLVAQVRLVARRRVGLHRRLGGAAALLAVAVVIVGVWTAIVTVREGHGPIGLTPTVFLMFPLSIMLIFAVLTAIAIAYRRRPDLHKRLLLLANVNLMAPALSRIPLRAIHDGGPGLVIGLTVAVMLACVAYDTIRNRKLHLGFAWASGLVILSFPLRMLIAHTETWQRVAAWLVA